MRCKRRHRIKRTLFLLLICCGMAVLSGCGSKDAQPAAEDAAETAAEEESENALLEFSEDHTFITDLPEEDLRKPERVIASPEDYIYALDYLAFYRIGDKIFFEIDPAFAEEIYNPYTVHQKAYEMADLADVYACQMDDSYYSEYGVIGIKYSMSKDIASEAPGKIPDTKVVPSFDYGEPAETSFEPAEAAGKEKISCENSEQLYYLVMNGYEPVPEEGSSAELLYETAKEVLSSRTDPEMTDFQKIKAVYDWLTTEVRYDGETAYSAETYLVKEQAYYLEGVFINHCAVCDGKAKAAALLLNMAGIPCYRTTGVNEGGDHAWNMVQLDGNWYIFCATYGQADMTDSLDRIVPNYSMLLAGKETPYEWYPAQKHQDIEAKLSESAYDIYGQMGADAGVSLEISGTEKLQTLLADTAACGKEEYKVEFRYTGTEKDTFQETLADMLSAYENANAAEVPCEEGTAYQIMIMQNN